MTILTPEQKALRGQIIAEVYREWAAQIPEVTPDPAYAENVPTAYAETGEVLTAPLSEQIALRHRTLERFEEAGVLRPFEKVWLEKVRAEDGQ